MIKETDLKEMLARFYNQEFTESGSPDGKSENGMSVEDVKFKEIMDDRAKMVTKHYQIPLPFRNPNIQLPNNRYQVWQVWLASFPTTNVQIFRVARCVLF